MKKIILSGLFFSLISLTAQGQAVKSELFKSKKAAVSQSNTATDTHKFLENNTITSSIHSSNLITNKCDQGDITTNSFDNGLNITETTLFRVAAGFTVDPSTIFTVDTITVDVNQPELPDSVTFNFREDNNGEPGTIVQTLTTIHTDSNQYGMAFGDPIYHLTFDLSSNPLIFTQGDYWMEVTMTVPSGTTVWWLASEVGSHPIIPMNSPDGGATWDPLIDTYMIFNLSGTCDPDLNPPSGYCIPGANCEDDDVITNVTFREINNPTGCSPDGYGDYTHLTATVAPGDSYPISVTVGSGWYERVSLWIDWNQDEVFDASEYVGEIDNGGQGVTLEDIITIPVGADDGQYRMRLALLATGQNEPAPDDPCLFDLDYYGEFEDYTLVVDSTIIGIGDLSLTEFSYYPNPANDVLYLNANRPIISVSGYNMLGQLLISDQHFSNNQIDVGSLPAGAYLFYITFDNGEKESFRVLVK